MKKFEVDFQKRLQQQAQARRKNLGLPEPDPKYKKYTREKSIVVLSYNIGHHQIQTSRPRFPDYEYKMMSDKEYLLSCIKNEGWRPLYG
jgi:hypothetical protein